MQLSYQVPMLNIVADNADWTSDWFRVPLGSSVRGTVAVTAIVGAPAGNIYCEAMTADGQAVVIFTLAAAAVGSGSNWTAVSSEFIRSRLDQAGGGNSLTLSHDLIISPPDTTPA